MTTDQDDSVIHVSTQESSHLCYTVAGNNGKISGRRLIRLEGDDRKRNLIHHIAVRTRYHPGLGGVNEEGVYEDPWERVILLTDKNCTVSGLFFRASALPYTLCANAEEEGEPIPVETHIAFEAQLPRSVTRLVKGNLRPPWGTPAFKRLGRLENAGYNVYEPHEFIGCSTDGTFHAIRLLSKRNLIILKCIQNLVEIKARRHSWLTPLHDRLGTPFLSRIFGDNNLRPSTSTPGSFSLGRGPGQLISRLDILGSFAHKKHVPKKNHVDGDVLERYLDGEIEGVEWDAKNALWTLFTARDVDEGVAKWFLQQVAVQVKELRATPAVQLILGGWLEGEDAELVGREGMGEVQDWVRRLLRDAV